MRAGPPVARAAVAVGAVCWLGNTAAARAQDLVPSEGGVPVPAAGATLGSGPPLYGTAVPATGASLEGGGSLREQIAGALGFQLAGDPNAPAVTYIAGVDVSQVYSTSSGSDSTGSSGDQVLTRLSPVVGANVNAPRATGTFIYAPTADIYESGNQSDRVEQNLRGNGQITLVPEQVFIKLKAYGSEQSAVGGVGPPGSVQLNTNDAVQNYSFSVNPYLLHQFGSVGSTELGLSVSETAQLVHNGQTTVTRPGLPPIAVSNQNNTSYDIYGAFASGEDFGRWLAYPYFTFTQYSGSGQFNGAYRDTVAMEGGYALYHSLDALAGIGLDRLFYDTQPPVRRDDGLWNVGARWTPNPDSSVTILYGRKDGYTAPYVDANYSITGRTRVFANYSVSVSTDQGQLLNNLLNSSFTALGDATDLKTGQPILLADNFFGLSQSVYKLTQGSIGAVMLADRDSYIVSLRTQKRDLLGLVVNTHGSNATSSNGTYASFHWQHELSPAVSGSLYGQYGVLTQDVLTQSMTTANSTQHVLITAASVSWAIANDLNTGMTVSRSQNFFGGSRGSPATELVSVVLRKTF